MKIQSPNHPIYIKACKREAAFRTGSAAFEDVGIPQRVDEYENLKKTGDKNTDEFAYLKSLGTFSRGLSLGSGGGSFELRLLQEGIVDTFVFLDISESAMVTLKKNAESMGLLDRIETELQDFNFLTLPENTYDLISCQNMLHHIINLEECLYSINQSLTDTGIFVTYEYIGENKMYWNDLKVSFIDTFQTLLKEQGMTTKAYPRTNPRVLTNNCPFESIRSEELYGIINYYFGDTAIRDVKYGHLHHAWEGISDERSNEYFDFLELFDTFVAENNLLIPTKLFGVYNKGNKSLRHGTPWSEKEMKEQIGVSSFSEKGIVSRANELKKRHPRLYNAMKKIYFSLR